MLHPTVIQLHGKKTNLMDTPKLKEETMNEDRKLSQIYFPSNQ